MEEGKKRSSKVNLKAMMWGKKNKSTKKNNSHAGDLSDQV